jgi:hypothetical protein
LVVVLVATEEVAAIMSACSVPEKTTSVEIGFPSHSRMKTIIGCCSRVVVSDWTEEIPEKATVVLPVA